MKKYNKQVSTFIKRTIKLDGLIFTAADTLYTIGSWDKMLTTQYKWKPADEQTVDLLVRIVSPGAAAMFVSKGGNIEPYQVNYKQVIVKVPPSIKDNDVAEFSLDQNGGFVFKELRKDKKTPNALRTVINVINSFKNPVNINDLYYFLNLSETSTKAEIKKVFKVSNAGKIAGSKVMNGEIKSKSKARIIRDGVVVYSGEIQTIYREKNQVKEVGAGLECGISLKDFIDFKEKDVIESYLAEKIQRSI